MARPEVEIDVDPESGIWRTDGLPMLYLPRHFMVNNHVAVEEALGLDTYRAILRTATDKSAVHWCKSTAKTLNLSPVDTFHRYFKRLSQRGWGQFTVDSIDLAGKRGAISLRNSVFVLEQQSAGRAVCYMFGGFMTGALRYLLDAEIATDIGCNEDACAAAGHPACRFSFSAN
jgi:predicted hydrocarbon binding protein